MQERLVIKVEDDGTFTIKRNLLEIGKAGERSARQVQTSYKAAMDQLRWQTKVALNSSKLAEKARVDAARAAAQEISRLRRSEARAAQDAARVAQAAARATTRVEVEQARARRRAEQAHRQKMRDAKKDATFGLGSSFGAVVGILGLAGAARSFVEYSDSAIQVSNRLKQVTSSQAQLEVLTQRLRETALDARAEFDLTTRTYARLAQATKQLNLSQGANLAMTETLTKAISVSGATGAEAHATLIQLSQAMASNRLSADEFRSVSEQLPIILDLLSKSTGKARVELKDMGEEGKLTSRVMSLALLEGLDQIREMFDKTAPTIEQAWENIRTQTRFAIEEFNKSTGASDKVIKALQWMAKNMDTVTTIVKALGAAIGVYLVTQIGQAAAAMATLAIANPWIAAATAVAALITLIIQYKEELKGLPEKHRTLEEVQAQRAHMKQTLGRDVDITEALAAMDERDAYLKSDQGAIKHAVDTEMAELDRRFAIADLKAQTDAEKKKKKGRGRHVPTFDEAVADLENDVKKGSLHSELQRDTFDQGLRITTQIRRDLTDAEREYVITLVKEKTLLNELEAAEQASAEARQKRYDDESKAITELALQMDKAREAAVTRRGEMLKIENAIHKGKFDQFSSEEDVKNARRAVRDMSAGGRLRSDLADNAMVHLERVDPNTEPTRKAFLEEITGMGQFAEQVNGIFGTEGTLIKGFADATASAIVFKESFSKSINALGKQIQAEIISTLVQSMIRMAILGATGGLSGSSTLGQLGTAVGKPRSSGGYITARGKGYAMGGYTGDIGRTRIAGYVHGGEHVMNASATQRIGVANLDYMNKTGQVPGSRGVSVKIINNSGVRLEQQPGMTRDEVVLIAREESAKHADRAVAGRIRDPNSHTAKAIRGNTNVRFTR